MVAILARWRWVKVIPKYDKSIHMADNHLHGCWWHIVIIISSSIYNVPTKHCGNDNVQIRVWLLYLSKSLGLWLICGPGNTVESIYTARQLSGITLPVRPFCLTCSWRKSTSISTEAHWKCIKDLSRPSDKVLWSIITFVQPCFPRSADFANYPGGRVSHLFWSHSAHLSGYANYHLKQNWKACQWISTL